MGSVWWVREGAFLEGCLLLALGGRRQEPRQSTRRVIWRRLGGVAERGERKIGWVTLLSVRA